MFKDKDRRTGVSNSWVDLDDRMKCSATVNAEVVICSVMHRCSGKYPGKLGPDIVGQTGQGRAGQGRGDIKQHSTTTSSHH